MNKKEKKLLIVLIIFILIFGATLCFVNYFKDFKKNIEFVDQNEDFDIEDNISENEPLYEISVDDKEISDVSFSDIRYIYDGKETKIFFEITNNNNLDIKLSRFKINVFDTNEEIIGVFEPVINFIIGSNNSEYVGISMEEDFGEAHRIEIELPNLEFIEE